MPIENALQSFADQKLKLSNSLMNFAGILSEDESDRMLHAISADHKNKISTHDFF